MANKDFSVLKWIIFPLITFGLAGGIAFFNVEVFGWRDAVSYLVALACVNAVSLVLLKFSGSTKRPVRVAAFTFECLLIAALVVNASYSISAQRDLSLVKADAADRRAELDSIGKLKSKKAQAAAAATLGGKTDTRQAFGEFEAVLRWIMIAELALSLGGLVAVYGLAAIKPGVRKVPRGGFRGSRPVISGAPVVPGQRQGIKGFGSAVEASGSSVEANGSTLEAAWKHVAANSSFRLTGQDSGVRVRDGSQYAGHIPWDRYLSAVADPERPTETEIRSLLNR